MKGERLKMKIGKKLAAWLLAIIMVLAMGMTSFAGEGKPEATDTADVTITDITGNPKITLYQIAEAVYGPSGKELVEYNWAADVTIQNKANPTADEINKIAQQLTGAAEPAIEPLGTITKGTLSNGTYTATVGAGVYIAILTGAADGSVYNPVLLSATYGEEGNLVVDKPEKVSANDAYLFGTTAVAKKTEPGVDKEITDGTAEDGEKETAGLGDVVSYKVTMTMPSYPANALNKTLFLTDTMSDGLTFLYDSLTVSIDGQTVTKEGDNFKLGDKTIATAHETGNGFNLNFDYDKLVSQPTTGAVYTPVVTYKGVVNNKAIVGETGNDNDVTFYYANEPNTGTTWTDTENEPDEATGVTSKEDSTTVYTYQIAFRKADANENTQYLSGAVFGIYKNEDCTRLIDQVTTNESGYAVSTKVSAGTYYLKELVAPTGYALNTIVYPVEASWTTATTTTKGSVTERTYTTENPGNAPQVGWIKERTFYELSEINEDGAEAGGYHPAYLSSKDTTTNSVTTVTVNEKGGGTVSLDFDIPNTKMIALPSTGGIGTTIFAIGGCVIMIAAAGLFFAHRRKTEK